LGEIKMRVFAVLGVSLLALAACSKTGDKAPAAEASASASDANAGATAGPAAMPKRKPGLWVQTVSTGGMNQTSKLCLDEATEAKMSVWGQQAGEGMCAKNVITPAAGGWSFDSECKMAGAGTIKTTGTATGDFNSKYVLKATSTTSGSSMPQANGVHEMEVTATYEGPCPAGMKPGDMTLPNGMTLNIANLPKPK
jgi:hypothetical protein